MAAKDKENPTFEEALENLESIVDSMESGETPLAELVEKFEEGNKLLKICQKRLKDAELRIEVLKREGKEPDVEQFELEADQ